MALNVKHLNSDASFLLSFEPIIPESASESVVAQPFTILLDPWITGPSKIFHSKISISTHKHPACITSLAELAQPPDLVIVSQHKSDHCNEATLRQLPSSGTKTLILAEPASARVIKSWKYFDKEKIRTIEPWRDPRLTGKQSVVRIPVPALVPRGQGGEVTVAFIPQKRDLTGIHGAIGITYRPPPTHNLARPEPRVKIFTPPTTPDSQAQTFTDAETKTPIPTPTGDTFLLPPSPPVSPRSLRSIRSASTLIASPTRPVPSPGFRPATASSNSVTQLTGSATEASRPISLLFSPHGISYPNLVTYVTSHLVSEAALPLTALLHCMDSINNPWWLGGNVCAGAPTGAEIAARLGARIWVSAHDGEKDVRGLGTGMLKTRRWKHEEVEGAIDAGHTHDQGRDQQPTSPDGMQDSMRKVKRGGPEIMRLCSGEEVIVTSTGMIWRSDDKEVDEPSSTSAPIAKAPAKTTTANGTKHQTLKGEKKGMNQVVLPKVQDAMSPKKLAIYRALKTRDLMRPSPKFVLERESEPNLPALPEVEPSVVPEPPAIESKKTAKKPGIECARKRAASDDRAVRFELTT
ncbi:Uu.00g043090.m01.CDS01 [Anthostomella pinea]|uniref:Uu.00g043090.m01.CDS01 n=1 Tax=Anthostomella pinea TaxID=933095 RepID=A0AAI8VAQ2_9PEZI|nr:Uu.00g043090.m01.CDS01 [Anthostomella pinea]